MNQINNKILIMSGKGGVGKTTIAVNLAIYLTMLGKKTGLLDVDIHGPNVPKMTGLDNAQIEIEEKYILPVRHRTNLKIMSLGFMVDEKDSVIWRGPMKTKLIKQFVEEINWGDLDYLVIDFPPGTGDEQISIAQLMKDITSAVIVSTPQQVAILDSVKSIDFCRKMNIPISGILENMSGDLFGKDTIKKISEENNIPYLGKLSLKKEIVNSGDLGTPFIETNSESSKEFKEIVNNILNLIGGKKNENNNN
jgi:ATP-binding protein involved in chromosome partitioning